MIVLTLDANDLSAGSRPSTLVLRDTTSNQEVERIELDPAEDVYRMLLPVGAVYSLGERVRGVVEQIPTTHPPH